MRDVTRDSSRFFSVGARRLNGAAKRFISEFKRRMSGDAGDRWSLEKKIERGVRSASSSLCPPQPPIIQGRGYGERYLPIIRRSA